MFVLIVTHIMNKPQYYCGIDPDSVKSAICINDGSGDLDYFKLDLYELHNFFKMWNMQSKAVINLEAGWLNKKSNWHKGYYKNGKYIKNSEATNELISKHTGENHNSGKQIELILTKLGYKVNLVMPLGKITNQKIFDAASGTKGVKNADLRDSIMLSLHKTQY